MTDLARPDVDALKPCSCCNWPAPLLQTDEACFVGQTYPKDTGYAGFKYRCDKCGLQTCWWHSEQQAREHWNTRATPASGEAAEGAGEPLVQTNDLRHWQHDLNVDGPTRRLCGRAADEIARLNRLLYLTAPPKPAPDAMRVKPRRPYIEDEPDGYGESDDCWIENNKQAVLQFLESSLAAPVPPPDGALPSILLDINAVHWSALRLVIEWWDGLPPNLRQDIEGSGKEPGAIAAARSALPYAPSGAGAAEPDGASRVTTAIRRSMEFDTDDAEYASDLMVDLAEAISDRSTQLEIAQQWFRKIRAETLLSAAPPVRGDREEIARALAIAFHGDAVEWRGFLTKADTFVAALPVQPGAGEQPRWSENILAHCDDLHDISFRAGWNGAVEECAKAAEQGLGIFSPLEIARAIRSLSRQPPHSSDGDSRG